MGPEKPTGAMKTTPRGFSHHLLTSMSSASQRNRYYLLPTFHLHLPGQNFFPSSSLPTQTGSTLFLTSAFTHLSNVLGVLQHTNAGVSRPAYLYLLLIDVQNSKDDKSFFPHHHSCGLWVCPRPLEPRPSSSTQCQYSDIFAQTLIPYSLSHFSYFCSKKIQLFSLKSVIYINM